MTQERYRRLRILLLQIEIPYWSGARSWSYDWHLGIEEGLRAQGVQVDTLTSPWFGYSSMLTRKRYDQVWVNDIVHLGVNAFATQAGLEWLANLAPVRLGCIVESAVYSAAEFEANPALARYRESLRSNLPYMTHVAAADENDARDLPRKWAMPAMWLPMPVAGRCIVNGYVGPSSHRALFSGSVYGRRAEFLNHPTLSGLLVQQRSSEAGTIYPFLFDLLPMHRLSMAVTRRFRGAGASNRPGAARNAGGPTLDGEARGGGAPLHLLYPAYLGALRYIRRKAHSRYLTALQNGAAVVNLPSFFKGYAGRVVEGMAAARPVISWEVPERPRVKALFEDDEEIILFDGDDPRHLAFQIERVLADSALRERLVRNATAKVRGHHTVEHRVRQILDWLERGETPIYA